MHDHRYDLETTPNDELHACQRHLERRVAAIRRTRWLVGGGILASQALVWGGLWGMNTGAWWGIYAALWGLVGQCGIAMGLLATGPL